jgi:glutamyl-tRNA(Gln) amidotransferase subunit E
MEDVGLKCGLEIHQQLEGKKLFCKCPTHIRDDNPHFTTNRKLRAVAGESGKVDIAALHEMQKGKWFAYESYKDTTCLVELDETPPERINNDALETALQVSLMMHCKIVDQAHIMRKTVVDGSNTSGFQRTGQLATNGYIDTPDGKVSIEGVSIEEDSARIIKNTASHSLYRLDRLGIPLVEIGTGPDIKTPEQAKQVAETIGLILRSTGKAKRGLGTIRQDVNVSIKGGERVEIKGAQDLKLIPTLIETEIGRQQALIEVTKELHNRKVTKIESKIEDLTHILAKSESTIIKNTLEKSGAIMGVNRNRTIRQSKSTSRSRRIVPLR